MSGPTGQWRSRALPSGQTGEAYVAMKRPMSMVQWKDGYPVVTFHTARGAGFHAAAVGNIPIADIMRHPGEAFPWQWATGPQLYPITASGEAKTLAYAKDQIRSVIQMICGTPRP